jgi:hypothetical protein
MIQATMYSNGAVRNAEGKLIGFFDRQDSILHINGCVETFKVIDEAHAMDLIGKYA